MTGTFFISLIIAILSGMGIGGGGLLVIYLVLIEGTAQMVAQGANLAFFIFAASASVLFSVKKKKIHYKITLVMSAAGMVFSLLGAFLARACDPHLLQQIFGGMLVLGGVGSLVSGVKEKK